MANLQQYTVTTLKQVAKWNNINVKGCRRKQDYIDAINLQLPCKKSFFNVEELSEDLERYPDYTLDVMDVKLVTHRLKTEKKVDIDETLKRLSSHYGLAKVKNEGDNKLKLAQILEQVIKLVIKSLHIHQLDFRPIDKLTPSNFPIKNLADYSGFVQLVIFDVQCLVNEISYQEGIYDGCYIITLIDIVEQINSIIEVLKQDYQQLCEDQELKKTFYEVTGKTVQFDLFVFLAGLSMEELIEFINKAPEKVLTTITLFDFLNRRCFEMDYAIKFYFLKAINCTLKQNYLKYNLKTPLYF